MKKISTLVSFLLFAVACFSQKNFSEAYVVNNNNDTIYGFINYKEWFRNPTNISFTESKEASTKKFTTRDIKSFSVSGKELFRRYVVKISMGKDIISEMAFRDTSSKTDTVFLKVLTAGRYIQLFSYTDEIKSRFYILPTDSTVPLELLNTEYVNDGQLISVREYRDSLMALAKKFVPENADLKTKIYVTGFYKGDILSIVNVINGESGAIEEQKMEAQKAKAVRFFGGVGLNKAEIKFDGTNHYVGKTSSGSIAPLFAGGFDILFNPYIGRLFLRTELSYSSAKTDAYAYSISNSAKDNYYLKLKQNTLSIHETLNFNFYNSTGFKYFLGIGPAFNFSSYPQNEETFIREASTYTTTTVNENYIAYIKKFWLNGIIRTGVTIKNIDVAVAYTTKGDFSKNAGYGTSISSLRLQVNYIFRK